MYLSVAEQIDLEHEINNEWVCRHSGHPLNDKMLNSINFEITMDDRDICIKSKMLDAMRLEYDKIEETL